MTKTLLTGGNGLIGSKFLNDKYLKPTSKEVDLVNQKAVDDYFKHNSDITNVIHCAAKVGGVSANMNNKGQFFYENIMMNTNVIEACRKYGIKKLVVFLSTCVFPDEVEYPLTETKIHLGPPHTSNDAYAYSKRMADIQLKAYREQYGLKYISVIPTNTYGPNDNFNLNDGHIIPALIHKCYLAKKNQTDFIVWGNGTALREFIYAKDVAEITEWLMENYDESEPIIISTADEVKIADVAVMIAEIMNFDGNIVFDYTKPNGQHRKPSDNAKLLKYLPNYKFTSLYDGLKETIQWFEESHELARK